ncbi:PQQ-dependent sugar dehydrogenase [Natronomonas sp. F2-12]|jgi:glucose/arabinose dehydrogenase|uniref:PQQ-dependent sugar dehydrogenase n=1 Tax=Natronomonas aquatica TaxID=2841590 RepID=A0A9R1CR49_9EURY|nr:PQQ-dependent sugar dehydrogenase [Natronomonas aquatica]MCQ4332211.1 PQQ-dependent sugar dehydrogenase [Natronomonas aquatica]
MDRRSYLSALGVVAAGSLAGCSGNGSGDGGSDGEESDGSEPDGADTDGSDTVGVTVETVTEGLEHPWGVAFLPDGKRLLVTERDAGRLSLVDRESGEREPLGGTPEVYAGGQGGLLDVAVHPGFPDEPWVYLTYSATNDTGASGTHLGRGRLDPGAARLSSFELLHAAEPFVESDGHYGSRVVFGTDGAAYLTVGDRQFKNFGPDHVAQNTTNELGATLRLAPDGSVPDDNPFLEDPDVEDTIFSYGHRNPQSMAVHPETGELWQAEHGERDGDEINVLERGGNYGWPVATYACEYGTDDPVGDRPDEREEFVEPVHYWECGSGGFPPSGAAFYDGEAFPAWRGDLFLGNLAGEYLGRFAVDGRSVEEREPLLTDRGWRIRAIESAPGNGGLHVAIDGDPAPIVRLVPE